MSEENAIQVSLPVPTRGAPSTVQWGWGCCQQVHLRGGGGPSWPPARRGEPGKWMEARADGRQLQEACDIHCVLSSLA